MAEANENGGNPAARRIRTFFSVANEGLRAVVPRRLLPQMLTAARALFANPVGLLRAALRAISQAALLATLFVLAWQRNWPIDLPGFDRNGVPFEHVLPTVRLSELLALGAVVAYALAGWPGHARLRRGPRRVFALSLIALLAITTLSSLWALHRGLALVHAGHMTLWVAFGLMLACGDWPAPRLAAAFLGGLLMHVWVGLLQFALQHFVGLGPRFGELPIRIGDGWSSVVYAGEVRLLRAYGLSGHPNILGGHVAAGLLLSFGLIVTWPRIWRALIAIAWAMAWGLLLITFSRSAWLALIGGAVVAALLLLRGRHLGRATIIAALQLAAIGAALALVFAPAFQAFLIGRVQPTRPEDVDSIEERQGMADLAIDMIAAHPLTGVGAANFSLMSERVLGYPIDWVHNVPLLVTSELGLPGLAAFAAMIGSLLAVARTRWRARSMTVWQTLIGGGLVALASVMFFDHYLWTAPQGTLLWAGLAGWWMAD